jgi:hypothetical protein
MVESMFELAMQRMKEFAGHDEINILTVSYSPCAACLVLNPDEQGGLRHCDGIKYVIEMTRAGWDITHSEFIPAPNYPS